MYQVRYPITIWLTNKMAIGKQRELTTFNRMKSEHIHEWAHAQQPTTTYQIALPPFQ